MLGTPLTYPVLVIHCAVSENIHTPPQKVFVLYPLSPPENSSLASYFASTILASKTPLPLGISNDLPWGGYGFFSGTAQYFVLSDSYTLHH